MRRTIYTIMLIAGTLSAYGQTPAQNEIKAGQKVEDAKENLEKAKKELNDTTISFRKDAKMQIKANNKIIRELKSQLIKPRRSPANDAIKKKIDEIENRNDQLRNRLYGF